MALTRMVKQVAQPKVVPVTWTFVNGLNNQEHSMDMVEPGATKRSGL